MKEIDEIDLKILGFLQQDGRMPVSEIGEKVELSSPSVADRIHKFEEKGIIQKYTAILNAREIGKDVTAFIGVSVSHPQGIPHFESVIGRIGDILECHHVTGEHTFRLKIKTRNTQTLEEVIRQIRSIEGVTRTETEVVLSTTFEHTEVLLNDVEQNKERPLRSVVRAR
ncbi:MAG: Lrp/AsnC family transcriptional regulator [Deltaproteobacteria bacterium]|nr:Lrp/AsnC family transcriptional regulator [Deltaproteobacteria bacterium]